RSVTLSDLRRLLNRCIGEANWLQCDTNFSHDNLVPHNQRHQIATTKIDAEVAVAAHVKCHRPGQKQCERTHAREKTFTEKVDVLRRNQMQHRDALQSPRIDKPTEKIPADDEGRKP